MSDKCCSTMIAAISTAGVAFMMGYAAFPQSIKIPAKKIGQPIKVEEDIKIPIIVKNAIPVKIPITVKIPIPVKTPITVKNAIPVKIPIPEAIPVKAAPIKARASIFSFRRLFRPVGRRPYTRPQPQPQSPNIQIPELLPQQPQTPNIPQIPELLEPEILQEPIRVSTSSIPAETGINLFNIIANFPASYVISGIYYFSIGTAIIAIPAYVISIIRRIAQAVNSIRNLLVQNIPAEIRNLQRDIRDMRDDQLQKLTKYSEELAISQKESIQELKSLKQKFETGELPAKLEKLQKNLDYLKKQGATKEEIEKAYNELQKAVEEQKDLIRKTDEISRKLDNLLQQTPEPESQDPQDIQIISLGENVFGLSGSGSRSQSRSQLLFKEPEEKQVFTGEGSRIRELTALEIESIIENLPTRTVNIDVDPVLTATWLLPSSIAIRRTRTAQLQRFDLPIVDNREYRIIPAEQGFVSTNIITEMEETDEKQEIDEIDMPEPETEDISQTTARIMFEAISDSRIEAMQSSAARILNAYNSNLTDEEKNRLREIYSKKYILQKDIDDDLDFVKSMIAQVSIESLPSTQLPVMSQYEINFWNLINNMIEDFDKWRDPIGLRQALNRIYEFLVKKGYMISKSIIDPIKSQKDRKNEIAYRRQTIRMLYRLILVDLNPKIDKLQTFDLD